MRSYAIKCRNHRNCCFHWLINCCVSTLKNSLLFSCSASRRYLFGPSSAASLRPLVGPPSSSSASSAPLRSELNPIPPSWELVRPRGVLFTTSSVIVPSSSPAPHISFNVAPQMLIGIIRCCFGSTRFCFISIYHRRRAVAIKCQHDASTTPTSFKTFGNHETETRSLQYHIKPYEIIRNQVQKS